MKYQEKKNIIPSLNGLRAISIGIVILSHLNGIFKFQLFSIFPISVLANGPMGVNIFFVISGFLITKLLIKEVTAEKSINLKFFYIRRSLRIFPAYYFLLFVYFVLQLSGFIHLELKDWIASITYTKQFYNNDEVLTGHFWSLSVEEFFYLFYPFFFLHFYNTTQKQKFTVILVVVVTFLFPLIRTILDYNKIYPLNKEMNIFHRGDALMIGGLLAVNYDRIKTLINRLKIMPLIALCFILLHQSLMDVFHVRLGFFWLPFGRPGISLFDNISIAIIIISCIEQQNSWYFKLLNFKLLNYLGLLSYSLYLWQEFFLAQKSIQLFNCLFLSLFSIFLCSFLSYVLIEKQFLKFKKIYSTN